MKKELKMINVNGITHYKKKNSKGYINEYPLDQGSRYNTYHFSDGTEDFTHLNSDYTTLDKHDTEMKIGDKVIYELDGGEMIGTGIVIDIFHSPMKIFVRVDNTKNNGILRTRIMEMEWDEIDKKMKEEMN